MMAYDDILTDYLLDSLLLTGYLFDGLAGLLDDYLLIDGKLLLN